MSSFVFIKGSHWRREIKPSKLVSELGSSNLPGTMDISMSFKDIKHAESLASTSSFALSDMFESSSTKTLNSADLELVEKNPQATWK